MRYRKKPVVVEAMQYPGPMRSVNDAKKVVDFDDWLQKHCAGEGGYLAPRYIGEKLHMTTIHGQAAAAVPGDWVICEPAAGRFYPVKADIFEATYEAAE